MPNDHLIGPLVRRFLLEEVGVDRNLSDRCESASPRDFHPHRRKASNEQDGVYQRCFDLRDLLVRDIRGLRLLSNSAVLPSQEETHPGNQEIAS